jgi:heptosyltransferase-2
LKKILVIQTASIGDVILVTSLLEKLHQTHPDFQLDVLVKDGNQQLFKSHPYLSKIFVWIKKEHKYKNLISLILEVRSQKYDYVINVQRFASSGLITMFSGAKQKNGFRKNPLSIFFSKRYSHQISSQPNSPHELERNHQLIQEITDREVAPTKLYPSPSDFENTSEFKTSAYVCIAPTSLWFTKQFPVDRWVELIKILPDYYSVYLLGAKNDDAICQKIIQEVGKSNVMSLCGKLSLLESAVLLKDAQMNYVNDSAPLHLACAVDAPVTALFCSTVPEFGFGPRTANSRVVEIDEKLSCRPCGLHGHKNCPEKHFKCAYGIKLESVKSKVCKVESP